MRRKSREAALQFLFQDDFACGSGRDESAALEDQFEQFCGLYLISRKARPYALELLKGIQANRGEIDRAISESATNWRLERINVTDRNLLRIGVFEMLFVDDVPPQVAINEALEIAKRFGSDESPAFINGVLDAVRSAISESP